MRVIVSGGGTGGHIFPGLEIAKEFREVNPRCKITYVGNTNSLEERMAKQAGLEFFGLNTRQIVGSKWPEKVLALIYLNLAILKSLFFLIKHRPNAVIGVGGYVSAPMIIASFILRINRYICEQNVVPGLTNKYLAYLSNKVFISFAETKSYFGSNIVLSGNPIRKAFFSINHIKQNGSLNILVAGGSMGASFLNQEVPKALALLNGHAAKIKITHQTGEAKLKEAQETYKNALAQTQVQAQVVPFIDNMPEAFRTHDLLISRAGATVAAEIMAAGMPAILVPYRFANGHQKDNALALAQHGGAVMLEESDNFAKDLAQTLKNFCEHPEQLSDISIAAKKLSTPKAAASIVKTVMADCS